VLCWGAGEGAGGLQGWGRAGCAPGVPPGWPAAAVRVHRGRLLPAKSCPAAAPVLVTVPALVTVAVTATAIVTGAATVIVTGTVPVPVPAVRGLP